MLVRHLSVQECDVVHLEHAVVSVDEVRLVLAVDEHHVPGAVSLPGNLVRPLAEEGEVLPVERDWLRAREAALPPAAHVLEAIA